MYFETFQKCCTYRQPGLNIDHQLEDTCRHKENTPPGSSWGTCDVVHCPMVRTQIQTNGDFMRSLDNEALAVLLASMMDEAIDRFIQNAELQEFLVECNDPILRKKQNIELLKGILDSPMGEIP